MAFPKNIKTYCDWMRQMAVDHKLLAHNDGDRNNASYQEIWLSGEHFEKIDWTTFLRSLKNQIKYPAMVNIGVDFNYQMIENDGRAIAQAQFAIVCKPDNSKPTMVARAECYDLAEGIARDILTRIEKYFEVNLMWGSLSGSAETEPIGPVRVDGDLYGVVCSFKYRSNAVHCYDSDKWLNPVMLEND